MVTLAAGILTSVAMEGQEPIEALLHSRFTAAITQADPTWREESSVLPKGLRTYSSIRWQRGDLRLSLRHYAHDTTDEAARTARNFADGSSVGFRPLQDYGDEAYFIDSPSSLSFTLILRRGTTVLYINSRDRDTVLKCGAILLREIEQARSEGLVQ